MSALSLLLCILLPAVATTRDPTRRIMCGDNMRRLMEGVFSYASDHQGKAPIRGWFSYTIAESSKEAYGWGGNTKVPVNLGMLYGKWTGGEHDRLYCPSTYASFRDHPAYGWRTTFDPAVAFSIGTHNYAVPLGQRMQASPLFTGDDPFPQSQWATSFVGWVNNVWQPAHPGLTFAVPDSPALAFDAVIGGFSPSHKTGINVMYMDGHVRYHDAGPQGFSNNVGGPDLWYRVSLKQ